MEITHYIMFTGILIALVGIYILWGILYLAFLKMYSLYISGVFRTMPRAELEKAKLSILEERTRNFLSKKVKKITIEALNRKLNEDS